MCLFNIFTYNICVFLTYLHTIYVSFSGVLAVETLQARKSGPYLYVEVEVSRFLKPIKPIPI
jgi:hypothetical protein